MSTIGANRLIENRSILEHIFALYLSPLLREEVANKVEVDALQIFDRKGHLSAQELSDVISNALKHHTNLTTLPTSGPERNIGLIVLGAAAAAYGAFVMWQYLDQALREE
jgi:hypothetical protein